MSLCSLVNIYVDLIIFVCNALCYYLCLGRVNCVQFNEDSSLVISGSVDGTVRAWDCRSRRLEPVQVIHVTLALALLLLLLRAFI